MFEYQYVSVVSVPHSSAVLYCNISFVFQAFVEMKNTPDAQKLVDYYSSNTLRINNDSIKVSFSGEYKSLMWVPHLTEPSAHSDPQIIDQNWFLILQAGGIG